jgi:hypothetical protein
MISTTPAVGSNKRRFIKRPISSATAIDSHQDQFLVSKAQSVLCLLRNDPNALVECEELPLSSVDEYTNTKHRKISSSSSSSNHSDEIETSHAFLSKESATIMNNSLIGKQTTEHPTDFNRENLMIENNEKVSSHSKSMWTKNTFALMQLVEEEEEADEDLVF